jgi:hypothetical protein
MSPALAQAVALRRHMSLLSMVCFGANAGFSSWRFGQTLDGHE